MRTSAPNTHVLGTVLDSLAAVIMIVASTAYADQSTTHGLAGFLATRFTLLNASFLVVFAVLWCQCFLALDPYRTRGAFLPSFAFNACGCAVMTATVGLYLTARHAEGPIVHILITFFAAALLYKSLRLAVRLASDGGHGRKVESVIILGSGRRASKAWRHLRTRCHRTKRVLGFVDDRDPLLMPPDIAGRYLGSIDDLALYLRRHAVDELVIAAPLRSAYEMMQRGITAAEAAGVRVVCLSDVFSLAHEPPPRSTGEPFVELVAKTEQHVLLLGLRRARQALGLP